MLEANLSGGVQDFRIDAEALVVIGTLMPHFRGVVRGRGGEMRVVGHRLPKGPMPHVLTTCTSFRYVGQEGGAQIRPLTMPPNFLRLPSAFSIDVGNRRSSTGSPAVEDMD